MMTRGGADDFSASMRWEIGSAGFWTSRSARSSSKSWYTSCVSTYWAEASMRALLAADKFTIASRRNSKPKNGWLHFTPGFCQLEIR